MFSRIQRSIQNQLLRHGRCIYHYPIAQYFRQFEIDCVLDVGANIGQTGEELRRTGFRGHIASFEPQAKAYAELVKHAKNDVEWSTYPYGLGHENSSKQLNISGMGPSSSFLDLSNEAISAVPGLRYVDTEQVQTRRLDEVFDEVCGRYKNIYLKIDTQGYEKFVIEGAKGVLERITGLQLELSLVVQYQGETPAEEMIAWIRTLGFSPYWILPGHRNLETMQLYQMDVVFFRDIQNDHRFVSQN
ncbi:MAG: FkbM family methyltransferase [Pirellulaceae bacterium]|nr:FkbM family methyltransferase [Pirellulaceae bacterium]